MNFASDNVMGASAPVLEAFVRANEGAAAAYGADAHSRRLETLFAEIFEYEVAVFPALTGTAANALALAALVPPWGLAVCHEESHAIDDECGAPEFFTHGAKLAGLPGAGAKLTPDTVGSFLTSLPADVKQMPPKALTISQATEGGLVYGIDEIAAMAELCRGRGLRLHMDGARFANALVALGTTPAEMTWKAGIDILSFGATKNGCLFAEAVVVFDPALAESLAYRRKRAGQLLSKGRFLAVQFEAYFAAGHWLDNARHANAMARRLADGLAVLPGVRVPWPVQANEVFPVIPRALDVAWREAGVIYRPWLARSLPEGEGLGEGEILIRLVASFATKAEQVDRLLAIAQKTLRREAAE
jgi:threonine aldolase